MFQSPFRVLSVLRLIPKGLKKAAGPHWSSTVILCTGKLPTWWVSSSELAWASTSCPLVLTPNAEAPRWPHHVHHQRQPRRPLPEEFVLTIRFFHWPLLSQCFSDLDTRESRPVHPPPSGPVLSETTSLSHRCSRGYGWGCHTASLSATVFITGKGQ